MATEHFTDAELRCRCECGGLPPQAFQDALEELRVEYGKPMRLSSAWRCPAYNARVSKTGRTGPHTKGAVDVLIWGREAQALLKCALRLGWTGVGVAQNGPHEARFLHLDRLETEMRPWVWSY